ncbi:PREDICTED: NF-kappa-B inhibitor cactus-like isoform X2 [Amphimedon queenslandica]|uniref:Uncharacterized protein n=1 Tax=Amphimedon queenslandica TaxID=400682 RepID=A0AAN0JAC0_AMPQE|nr:PREDICTED: NF-kappa-B inhibitor cactus-like isoform X2 [Amphimedon queenslandica]|eukprot:XP_019853663.1 PREDICTED: NF-kappa-B inhibitor cactus-like isoform X2 [Amphimedon queenslandica]
MERSQLNKGSLYREGGSQDRLSPSSASSPDKRRYLSTISSGASPAPATPLRLISRGCPEPEEEEVQEVIRTQVSPGAPNTGYYHHQTKLDTSASRKRKILNNPLPSPNPSSLLVLPSPTTQIARRIDSINLETLQRPSLSPSHSSPGSHLTSSVSHMQQESDRLQVVQDGAMEVGTDVRRSRSPSNSPSVPPVGQSVEIPAQEDHLLESYIQRPPEAVNMKRLVPSDEEMSGEETNWRTRGSSKIPKTTAGVSPQGLSNHTKQSPRVPTIHQPSSLLKKKHFSPSPNSSTAPSPVTLPQLPLLPLMFPLVSSSSLLPSLTQSPPTAPPLSSSQQTKTKTVSSFSINDLLAKEPTSSASSKQQAPPTAITPNSYPLINPTLLLLYQQQYNSMLAAALAAANGGTITNAVSGGRLFQGEPAEKDNLSSSSPSSSSLHVVHDIDDDDEPPLTLSGSVNAFKRNESASPLRNRYSPRASPGPTNDSTVTSSEERLPSVTPPSEGLPTSNAEGGVRQNALLQVGEAHLAILPDEDGDTPLHLAIIQENIPLTFYLVRLITGVSMSLDIANNLRQTPLHLAVITAQPMLVNLLVQAGASVNCPDRKGNTCVHLAAQRKNVGILQILSQAENHSPDYNARNFGGLTPVHVATKEGSIDVLKFLLQMGANRNMADSCSGRTALHYAVEAQNFQVCNFLLENNVNVNAVTFSGNTPLHVAAGRRLKEIVALLMAYGANPSIANGEGDFPSDLPASLLVGHVVCSL